MVSWRKIAMKSVISWSYQLLMKIVFINSHEQTTPNATETRLVLRPPKTQPSAGERARAAPLHGGDVIERRA
jgi:hypothetical protein